MLPPASRQVSERGGLVAREIWVKFELAPKLLAQTECEQLSSSRSRPLGSEWARAADRYPVEATEVVATAAAPAEVRAGTQEATAVVGLLVRAGIRAGTAAVALEAPAEARAVMAAAALAAGTSAAPASSRP